jgi:hypothetical protein
MIFNLGQSVSPQSKKVANKRLHENLSLTLGIDRLR